MADNPTVVTTFKDLDADETVREAIDKRCASVAEEFPEVSRIEITLSEDGAGFAAHGLVSAKGTQVGAHADASELQPAADRLLDRIGRQLRKAHDKRIFTQRREAQRDPPKKKNST